MQRRIIDDISKFMFIEDPLKKADAILIPGGLHQELPIKAAELWKEGYAPYIVPSGKYSIHHDRFTGIETRPSMKKENKVYETECEFYTDILVEMGVRPEAILKEEEARSTAENASLTRKLLGHKNISLDKAIICCKTFHARRCLMFYQFAFPKTEFIIVPVLGQGDIHISKDNWYQSKASREKVLEELSKLGTQFKSEFDQL